MLRVQGFEVLVHTQHVGAVFGTCWYSSCWVAVYSRCGDDSEACSTVLEKLKGKFTKRRWWKIMTPHNVKESMQVKELDNCKRELTSSQRFHTFIEVLALTAKEPILPASWSSQKVFKGCFLPLQSAAPLTLPGIQQILSSTWKQRELLKYHVSNFYANSNSTTPW